MSDNALIKKTFSMAEQNWNIKKKTIQDFLERNLYFLEIYVTNVIYITNQ